MRNSRAVTIVVFRLPILLIVMGQSLAASGTIEFEFELDPSTELSINDHLSWDVIDIAGGMVAFGDMYPGLPGRTFSFVIPQGTSLTGVDVEVISEIELEGSYAIAPVRCVVVDGDQSQLSTDYSGVYLSDDPFPASPVVGITNGSKTGFRVASFTFVPFVYHPLSSRISVVTAGLITLRYNTDPSAESVNLTETQTRTAKEALSVWLENPEMLDTWSPRPRADGLDENSWIVVAPAAWESLLQPLIDHRASDGLQSEFVSLEWIQTTYSGWDSPEMIRNYLKESYLERGLVYALIVGDSEETIRKSSYFEAGYPIDAAADLYFSDLDGSWDANGNHLYGEAGDSLDYYSDIYVGRFPASGMIDLWTMIEKTLDYETDPPAGEWQTRALLCGALLFPEYDYNGDRLCDSLLQRIPSGWQVDVLLEDPSGSNPENQLELFNEGVAFVEPVGHGSNDGIWWMLPDWELMFGTDMVSQMTNGDMLSVWQSIACHPGHLAVDDCFGEWLLKHPDGGGVAVRFNSSYGRANPPYCGPSEYLDIYFAELLFVDEQYRLGIPHASSKDQLYPTSVPKRLFAIQELNFLGDPYLLFITGQTGIEPDEHPGSAGGMARLDIRPNPSTGPCTFALSVPQGIPEGSIIEIYDISGRLLRQISLFPQSGDGIVTTGFDGLDQSGTVLPSGCYLVTFKDHTGSNATGRMVLLR